ncbi:hypothetical protein SAMN02799630_01233 [Paenibacillus sp. UNCCL117]|uniref:hypothetical protein n=1 Tax=unclassified Paenibacillus TaxID=185978 RepID=UPI00088F3866|nr:MULTISPECIES: hypothetical protein [unclassified Paenibacillus]SDC70410.1 hypothetical protein SAMN04488602_103211 [Paenibacillus sp. cl123]SFW24187.1 hypothetical protein SAMN02799630_01233 [Paenibacillus sp. UNCCL117]
MAQLPMYSAVVNSPQTELTAGINATQTTVPVVNASLLPPAPNLVTIGTDESAETILYTGISSNTLTGVTRAFQGQAKAWSAGSKVARFFTAYDHDTFKNNIEDILAKLKDGLTLSAPLRHGLQVITADQSGPARVTVQGMTLQNILGIIGDCENLTGWTTAAVTVDTTVKRYGDASFKMFGTGASRAAYRDIDLDATKTYVAVVDAYVTRFVNAPNLAIYDKGGFSNGAIMPFNTAALNQWQTLYVKFTGRSGIRFLFGRYSGSDDFDAYFDGASLYEVDATTYAAVGTTITASNIRDHLPFVNGMQSVTYPAIVKTGRNLLPPFTEWTLHANAAATEPYKLTLNATGSFQNSTITIPALPNTQYVFSVGNAYIANQRNDIYAKDANGANIGSAIVSSPTSFTTPAGTAFLQIHVTSQAAGTFVFTNPMLILGTSSDLPQSFEPRNDDYAVFVTDSDGKPGKLAADPISGVFDLLFQRDNVWYKFGRFREVTLEGSQGWKYNTSSTGYKRVRSSAAALGIGTNYVPVETPSTASKASKFDGKPLSPGVTSNADMFNLNSDGFLYLTLAAADTGWTDAIHPNDGAAAAAMNGWKAVGNNGTVYNSWVSVLTGSAPPTNTEAYVSANKAPGWTGWATLVYQRAQAVDEAVTLEGAISMHSGGNLVELTEGVIRRELATVGYNSSGGGFYRINVTGHPNYTPNSPLKYRAARILAVYKGAERDYKWSFATDPYAYGAVIAQISAANYDPSAKYYVTYIALDRQNMTANAIDGRVEYPGNPGSAISTIAQALADAQTKLTVHDWALILAEAYSKNNEINIASVTAALATHRTAAVMDHPPGSVGTDHLGSKIVTAAKLADGAATDTVMGNRTLNDTTTPTLTGTLTTLLSGIMSLIKGITGKSSVTTAPRTTLENAVKRDGDTMTGGLTAPAAAFVQSGDATVTIEDTGAPNTSYRRKVMYSSRNVEGGDGWLFRQQRPSDGTMLDYVLGGPSGSILTSGNSLMMRNNGGTVEFWNGTGWQPVGAWKPMQRGTTAIPSSTAAPQTAYATINAVDLSKARLRILSFAGRSTPEYSTNSSFYAKLINPTTIEFYAYNLGGFDCSWEIEESI